MDKENEASSETYDAFSAPEASKDESIITTGRIVNAAIAAVCLAAMISCIVCLAVMTSKHKSIINNFDPTRDNSQSDQEVCILFTTVEEIQLQYPNGTPAGTQLVFKYNRSHTCQFVIYGSGFVAGLLILAALYHGVRLFIWTR